MKYQAELNLWKENAVDDADLINELNSIEGNEDEVIDRFYKELEFGTGGLRGVIGAGTNRMNVYTVGKAAQGLSCYVNGTVENGSIAIAYDSRIKSDVFAKCAASVFAANGIKVYIYKELMPTPMLSYAVRALNCDAGCVVTASHNPAKYNGFKVYGPDGCQLTIEAADIVLSHIEKTDIFTDVKRIDFDEAVNNGMIEFIGDDIIENYLCEVAKQSVNPEVLSGTDFKVVYTPLNGAGNKPVRAILDKIGIKNVTVVKSQELPDGNFPTAPYPNPEIRQAFEEALKVAEEVKPDILLATDPDSDRVGIAVNYNGEYRLMTGNEVGAMLLDYILTQRTKKGTMPKDPIAVKTIVTTDLATKIAKNHGCDIINVLTGFKFIGEQIGFLEEKNEQDRYIFGFEESYGYLAGSYVRDKDAVVASMLICEMAAYYKNEGVTLVDVMDSLYKKYGYFLHKQLSFTCEGVAGMQKISEITGSLRNEPPTVIGGLKVIGISDYDTSLYTDTATGKTQTIDLPRSNVLFYHLESDAAAIVRPSGTEPKIKVYLTAVSDSKENAEKACAAIEKDMTEVCK